MDGRKALDNEIMSDMYTFVAGGIREGIFRVAFKTGAQTPSPRQTMPRNVGPDVPPELEHHLPELGGVNAPGLVCVRLAEEKVKQVLGHIEGCFDVASIRTAAGGEWWAEQVGLPRAGSAPTGRRGRV